MTVTDHSRLFPVENVIDTDDWYTPEWIFAGLEIEFDLDVASPDDEVPWIPATKRYTVADDGLNSPWFGTVWCNPPYSSTAKWCRKWAAHGNGLLLIRSDLSTGGPFVAFSAASSIYVPARRLQFVNGAGGETGKCTFSTVLLGAGVAADAGIARLATSYGGTARALRKLDRWDA